LLKDYSLKKENQNPIDQPVLISSPNNKKINELKLQFSKSKEALLVDCYPLNKSGKEIFLNDFINKHNLRLSNEVFWYVVENFENELVLFKKQLESLSLLKKEISSAEDVEGAVYIENKTEINKIFFYFLKNNASLIKVFKKNIYTQSDFYIFLNSLKLYMGIIGSSPNIGEALKVFPRYLFNEKDLFVTIYNKLDKKKVLKIYKNIQKVEALVRKNSSLFPFIGLRFIINTKKIITS